MTTELVLLLLIFTFMLSAFLGVSGPKSVFADAGPRLGARIEQQMDTGRGFTDSSGNSIAWSKPNGAAPQ
jgi:hypothetical protein